MAYRLLLSPGKQIAKGGDCVTNADLSSKDNKSFSDLSRHKNAIPLIMIKIIIVILFLCNNLSKFYVVGTSKVATVLPLKTKYITNIAVAVNNAAIHSGGPITCLIYRNIIVIFPKLL